MNNNEPDTLPDPAIGYIFQNDILALKQAFSLPDIDYADISQREQLSPGQGVGLAVAREITEQYEGKIVAGESMLGGARMEVIFGRQHSAPKDE